jgi:ABC-type multidrug transport system ATPase subunit
MEPIIKVEHLTKRYRNAAEAAVDDISFEVEPGELFAFLVIGTIMFVRADRNR